MGRGGSAGRACAWAAWLPTAVLTGLSEGRVSLVKSPGRAFLLPSAATLMFLGFHLDLKEHRHAFGEDISAGGSEVLPSSLIANKVAFQFVLVVTYLIPL